ncbi:carbohydrate kinase [Streptomyces pluripotens]|uniref:Carbohydrate kinase n=1 Tax=Streptomyces pluripotens TaxID=1355015 RepID=A0A221P6Q6_9ACTN|nr:MULTISPECIES: FGGY family carbohydrate kinase [Streptomyces]ARP73737.1 carbohydrate kinase [Streptomyces pluripotens]ASN27983.1 carbohydrate kinase [Streptomyces pluripotens]KIE27901.1 carbohydrate kinase [Streptomyces sp. MUSC 125]MCH0559304.1 carbohydrate kinase [Streptomyces sp. MUM 16J]
MAEPNDLPEVWLGIDLGTQSVRVLAVDAAGGTRGSGAEQLRSHRDGPRHEQDPEQWWSAVRTACRRALDGLAGAPVRGVAVCATSGTILLADHTGRALTPGLMYDDSRAVEEASLAAEAVAAPWGRLGHRPQPSWALPKLLWLLGCHPRVPTGARLVHQADYIGERLTGGPVAADSSHALKTGYDTEHETWPTALFEELRVPVTLLPDVVRPGTVLGAVCAQAAEATGIPEGTPLVAGMTDGCAAQISAGALEPGAWNSVLGTTLVLKGVTPRRLHDPLGVVYSHRAPNGNWLPGGASSTGAGVLSRAFPGRNLAPLDARAERYEPSSLVTYPLASRGERFPFLAPEAEGFTLGDLHGSVEADYHASLLQGVAFVERLCFDYLGLLGAPLDGPVTLTGGGARSRYWCQLRADVLARPVGLPDNAEAALGMAVLARAGTAAPLTTAARDMVRLRTVVEPRPRHTQRLLESHLRLVAALEERGWLPAAVADHARRRVHL